jgi:hypothetical protein
MEFKKDDGEVKARASPSMLYSFSLKIDK